MIREHPGNVVVLSGRNRPKIGPHRRVVGAGLHVLADKPWILRSGDFAAARSDPGRGRPQRASSPTTS